MSKIKFASIITTYRCNAHCRMCDIWRFPTKTEEEISPAVIDKLPFIPTINITGGEPFLREDINEILAILKPKSRRVVVSTNGFMTERILDVVRKNPWIGIRISLEGLPKVNDELRGIKDGFDHGIRTLVELNHINLVDIGFGITVSDDNAHDLMKLYHLAKMLKVEFSTAAVHNSFYFKKMDNRFEKKNVVIDELEKLIVELLKSKRVKDWFRAYFNYGLVNYIKGNSRLLPCRMGHEAFFLDPFGEIRPCNGGEGLSMGNLKDKTFDEIWDSKAASRIRAKVSECDCNCWMMGNVAEPMKQHVIKIAGWILKKKFLKK